MMFGIYCEVQIETLRQIKLKYVEDYDSLVQFMTDFHLLTGSRRPSILAIDSLDFFLENRTLSPLTKQMRLHYILNLAADAQRFLNKSNTFEANNLVLAYRCSPLPQDSQENANNAAVNNSVSSEATAGQNTANDFSKLYTDFSNYTNQIYYLSRSAVSSQTDQHLLNSSQIEQANLNQVELYQAQPNLTHFEEEHAYAKKSAQQKMQERRPLPFKLVSVTADERNSVSAEQLDESCSSGLVNGQAIGAQLFVPILLDLRKNVLCE